jgi:hypothetical protein
MDGLTNFDVEDTATLKQFETAHSPRKNNNPFYSQKLIPS